MNVHLSHAGQCVSVVTLLSVASSGNNSAVWKGTDDLAFARVKQILAPVTYPVNDDETYSTLLDPFTCKRSKNRMCE